MTARGCFAPFRSGPEVLKFYYTSRPGSFPKAKGGGLA